MTFVPIIDPGVAVRPNSDYYTFDQGFNQQVFIKKYDSSGPLTGGVWPGNAYFPDFFNPQTTTFWAD